MDRDTIVEILNIQFEEAGVPILPSYYDIGTNLYDIYREIPTVDAIIAHHMQLREITHIPRMVVIGTNTGMNNIITDANILNNESDSDNDGDDNNENNDDSDSDDDDNNDGNENDDNSNDNNDNNDTNQNETNNVPNNSIAITPAENNNGTLIQTTTENNNEQSQQITNQVSVHEIQRIGNLFRHATNSTENNDNDYEELGRQLFSERGMVDIKMVMTENDVDNVTLIIIDDTTKNLDQQECLNCYDSFVDTDLVRILPCGHKYHRSCIDSQLKTESHLCPTCKCPVGKYKYLNM
jgi:hypothetical protein